VSTRLNGLKGLPAIVLARENKRDSSSPAGCAIEALRGAGLGATRERLILQPIVGIEPMRNWKEQLTWLRAGAPDNPFAFDVLDCRAACESLALTTANETASEAFASLEKIVESSSPAKAMADGLSVSCTIKISRRESLADHSPFEAKEAGHRWLLELAEENILARRRWTGQLIHIAEFETLDRCSTVKRVTSQLQSVYNSPDYALAEMEFLLRTYIEKVQWAFPIPPGVTRQEMPKIALNGWKAHGPIAKFARFL
jgi:hypothetical protein